MEMRSQKDYWNGVASEKRFAHPLRFNWLASHFSVGHTILTADAVTAGSSTRLRRMDTTTRSARISPKPC
jgi:hypothetical protein